MIVNYSFLYFILKVMNFLKNNLSILFTQFYNNKAYIWLCDKCFNHNISYNHFNGSKCTNCSYEYSIHQHMYTRFRELKNLEEDEGGDPK